MDRNWHRPQSKKNCVGSPEVDYCGFTINEHSYRADLFKVFAELVPTRKTDVRSFCGIFQQFKPFSPRLTDFWPLCDLYPEKKELLCKSLEVYAGVMAFYSLTLGAIYLIFPWVDETEEEKTQLLR